MEHGESAEKVGSRPGTLNNVTHPPTIAIAIAFGTIIVTIPDPASRKVKPHTLNSSQGCDLSQARARLWLESRV